MGEFLKEKIIAVIFLIFLAPITAELLSGSAPPSEFFNPLGFIVLIVLYGFGAVLVREINIAWGKNFISLILLGAIYGIIEEGFMVKSFFDPNWMDLGILGVYGRFWGVNWIWTLKLTIYHAIYSIVIPIQITELIFYKIRKESWIRIFSIKLIAIIFLLDIIFGNLVLTKYQPTFLHYIFLTIIVFIIGYLAYKVSKYNFFKPTLKFKNTAYYFILGFGWSSYFLLSMWIMPHIVPPILMVVIEIIVLYFMYRILSNYEWLNPMEKLALISGILAFLIILAPLQELDKNRLDDTRGMSIVGISYGIFLLITRHIVKKRISYTDLENKHINKCI